MGRVGVAELCRMAAVAAAPYRQTPGVDLMQLRADVVGDLLEVVIGWERTESRPDNAGGYLWRVAQAAAQLAAWRLSSPVTVTEHARRTRGLMQSVELAEVCAEPAPQPSAEQTLADLQWQARVQRRVLALSADLSASDQAVVRACLLGESAPHEAAVEVGVPVQQVWCVTRRMRRRILADAELRALHGALIDEEVGYADQR